MGYTRYWRRTEEPLSIDFLADVNKVFKDAARYGIAIRGADGTGKPELELERVAFNGNEKDDLCHESFILDNETGFNFCKTARKPYDYVVRTVLRLALDYGIVKEVSDDGYNEQIYSDEMYLQDMVKW